MSCINSDNVTVLAWIDEQEPKAQILADLQESVPQVTAGQTLSVSELWEDITTYLIGFQIPNPEHEKADGCSCCPIEE
ncbi:hypothetical protein Aazo_0170 ['Nostoc azollae' 0708]|jgi:hypothetical protein|uniref:Uncharacterized protein n=1 Tax=Nostoc azollae (strain 0708) TaxID=551115 RepID=D7DYI0_NOSA0|nr:hypothetical protein Aazo_0170 ['Nostoc azollae' 0708]